MAIPDYWAVWADGWLGFPFLYETKSEAMDRADKEALLAPGSTVYLLKLDVRGTVMAPPATRLDRSGVMTEREAIDPPVKVRP